MFGRRRRPILGAAVVVGASRSAARHEVERQAAMNTQRELEIQREVELQRRNEEEQERRMQRAVDEAIQKAAVENPAPQPSAAALAPPPPQQYYSAQSPIPVQTQDMGFMATMPGQPYTPGINVSPSIQPEQLMPSPPQPPAYSPRSISQDGRPRSAQGISPTVPAAGLTTKYCTQCGFACQDGDRFCRQCGAKQVGPEGKVE